MSQHTPEHHIQLQIYQQLVNHEWRRYSELKPASVEANLFMYHLNELMKQGLVAKLDKRYTLTDAGKSLANRFSLREQKVRITPSTISVLFLEHSDGQVLLYERKRQPFIGALGFPSGKIHLGESLADAARRELSEKCSYTDAKLQPKGQFGLLVKKDGLTAYHVLGNIWHAVVEDKIEFDHHAGRTFWADWTKYDYSQFIPGFREIMEAAKQPQQFLLDLEF